MVIILWHNGFPITSANSKCCINFRDPCELGMWNLSKMGVMFTARFGFFSFKNWIWEKSVRCFLFDSWFDLCVLFQVWYSPSLKKNRWGLMSKRKRKKIFRKNLFPVKHLRIEENWNNIAQTHLICYNSLSWR